MVGYDLLMKRSELFFKGHDGTKLYLQKWEVHNPTGTILLTHGQAEHSDCYQRFIEGLHRQSQKFNTSWNVIAWDMRGHGKSDGLRGYAHDFDDYVLDYHCFIEESLRTLAPDLKNSTSPLILAAHSMGGLVQTCALREKKHPHFQAQILSSPMFGVSVEVPAWKDLGSVAINRLFPKLTLGNEIKNEDLTRDLEIIKEYEKDTYRHNKISAGVYLGFKREFEKVLSYAHEIHLPTLLHISDNDPIVSSPIALKFFDNLSSTTKELKIIEGGRHELYNDSPREDVFAFVAEFLNRIIKG